MKQRSSDIRYHKVKESRFPPALFGIYLGVLLLMSGIHTGLIVLMNELQWNNIIQSILPMIYWGLVAVALTLFTRGQIRKTYEDPMQNLARATRDVANGDFSVYLPTTHTADKLDYLDIMILDFNKMVEELGSIETLKTDFVSNVSHEMKTPISIIKNYAELLRSDTLTDEQRKDYARSIEEASIRLSDLISNILKLNKLENQSIVPETSEYDVNRQLCDCVLQFEEIWESKEIELDMELDEKVMIQGDSSLLEMVWNNLLANAFKFTEPGGTVSIRQTTSGQGAGCQISNEGRQNTGATHVQISISDTGCGMSKENVRHIFDKFYQGDTSHSGEGNGLGLALVKRILELSDGDIQVMSEPGKGSSFTVTLPAAHAGASAEANTDNGGNSQ